MLFLTFGFFLALLFCWPSSCGLSFQPFQNQDESSNHSTETTLSRQSLKEEIEDETDSNDVTRDSTNEAESKMTPLKEILQVKRFLDLDSP